MSYRERPADQNVRWVARAFQKLLRVDHREPSEVRGTRRARHRVLSPGASARVGFYVSVLGVALLAGCDRAPIGHWIEEVKLSDGSTLWVDQKRKYRTFSELGGPGAAFDEKVTLNFKAGEQPVPEWSERLFPVLLDRDPNNGEWIVVATTTESREWRNRGEPLVPYWQFRLRGGDWREEPLSDFVWNRKVNLLVGIFNLEKNGERVSWDTKREWRLDSTPTPRFWKIDPKGRIGEGSHFPDLTKQEMLEE